MLKKRDSPPNSDSTTSSTGSASTPDDDRPLTDKPSWRRWLRRPRPPLDTRRDDEESEDDSASSPPCSIAAPEYCARALQAFIVITQNSLLLPPHTPISPFHNDNHGPIFPRSINLPHLLPRPPSFRVKLLKSRLLQRYSETDSRSSSSGLVPILPLATKNYQPLFPTPSDNFPDISRPLTTPQSNSYPASTGVNRWITRPCFEDRCQIYLPSDFGLESKLVTASFPIAAIEYSPHLHIMAVPDLFANALDAVDESTLADTSAAPQSPPLSGKLLQYPFSNPFIFSTFFCPSKYLLTTHFQALLLPFLINVPICPCPPLSGLPRLQHHRHRLLLQQAQTNVSFALLKVTVIVLMMSFPFISSVKENYENRKLCFYARNDSVVLAKKRRNGEYRRRPNKREDMNEIRQRRNGGRRSNPCIVRRW